MKSLNKDQILENTLHVVSKIKSISPDAHLVAVTKTHPESTVEIYREVANELGISCIFGENYLQEILDKRNAFKESELHFIGRLQSNKIKTLLSSVDVIESVGSASHVSELKKASGLGLAIPKIFLQVNISQDPLKAGFLPHEVSDQLEQLRGIPVVGFMTILEDSHDELKIASSYRLLRVLRDSLNPSFYLSMGMSGDYEIALKEGATHIRVGSAIFGGRVV